MDDKQTVRVKRAHVTMMKHKSTALYSGVMLMGKSDVTDGSFTAYTDGYNKRYCNTFVQKLTEPCLRGVVLHENLHVLLKHLLFGKDMFKKNAMIANVAADFVVNAIIKDITDRINGELLVDLPEGGLYDPMFRGWSMREVFNYIYKENSGGGGGGDGKGKGSGDGDDDAPSNDPDNSGSIKKKLKINGKEYDVSGQFDEHDFDSANETPEEIKETDERIDRAIREGGILAGRMGGNVPRAISEVLEPKIDWKAVLRDFVNSSTKGKDEFTWRKMNKRHLANDMYLPSVEDETVGEIIYAVDTSGSISNEDLAQVAGELASLCELCQPERVRVLWWDTQVHGEQIFESDYGNIAKMLKPMGGGGTRVASVSDYINEKKITAECLIVHTDGYVESNIDWKLKLPTLWLVTMCRSFNPPSGKKVMLDK
jgi:predicted metal-dependent peptidase